MASAFLPMTLQRTGGHAQVSQQTCPSAKSVVVTLNSSTTSVVNTTRATAHTATQTVIVDVLLKLATQSLLNTLNKKTAPSTSFRKRMSTSVADLNVSPQHQIMTATYSLCQNSTPSSRQSKRKQGGCTPKTINHSA